MQEWRSGQRTEVGGRRSEVGGRWSVVGGRWSVVGGRWSVVEVGRYRRERSHRDEEGMPRRTGTSELGLFIAFHWRATPAVQRYL